MPACGQLACMDSPLGVLGELSGPLRVKHCIEVCCCLYLESRICLNLFFLNTPAAPCRLTAVLSAAAAAASTRSAGNTASVAGHCTGSAKSTPLNSHHTTNTADLHNCQTTASSTAGRADCCSISAQHICCNQHAQQIHSQRDPAVALPMIKAMFSIVQCWTNSMRSRRKFPGCLCHPMSHTVCHRHGVHTCNASGRPGMMPAVVNTRSACIELAVSEFLTIT
jgi:hypothetical protein